jgi:hypothetical protein
LGSEIFRVDPWQDQESGVVDDQMKILFWIEAGYPIQVSRGATFQAAAENPMAPSRPVDERMK